MKKEIGKKIRKIRDGKNLSQKRFAKKIGLSEKTISAYENGRITPPYRVLEKISNTYGITIISFSEDQKQTLETKIKKLEDSVQEVRSLIL